jgi:hypothetical protein
MPNRRKFANLVTLIMDMNDRSDSDQFEITLRMETAFFSIVPRED